MLTRERLYRYRWWLAEKQAEPRAESTIDWREDAVRDLLAEVERLEAEVKAAHRYAEEQIAANSRTLDEIVELLRPGETLDDEGILAAVRALVEAKKERP